MKFDFNEQIPPKMHQHNKRVHYYVMGSTLHFVPVHIYQVLIASNIICIANGKRKFGVYKQCTYYMFIFLKNMVVMKDQHK